MTKRLATYADVVNRPKPKRRISKRRYKAALRQVKKNMDDATKSLEVGLARVYDKKRKLTRVGRNARPPKVKYIGRKHVEKALTEAANKLHAGITRAALLYGAGTPLPSAETIDHPFHYGGDSTYEAIKVIEAWQLGFNLGNAVKYIIRADWKGSKIENLQKAVWYLERQLLLLQAPICADCSVARQMLPASGGTYCCNNCGAKSGVS